MEKLGSWCLLEKCVGHTCGRLTFYLKMQVGDLTYLLKISLFHWCFSHILLVETNQLIFSKAEHWLEMG